MPRRIDDDAAAVLDGGATSIDLRLDERRRITYRSVGPRPPWGGHRYMISANIFTLPLFPQLTFDLP